MFELFLGSALGKFGYDICANMVADKAKENISQFMTGFSNHDIQKALRAAWKKSWEEILQVYKNLPEYRQLGVDRQKWVEQLIHQSAQEKVVDKLFAPKTDPDAPFTVADVGRLEFDQAAVERQWLRELPQLPIGAELSDLGALNTFLETSLLPLLRFYFLELGIKRDDSTRHATFYQQFNQLRQAAHKTEADLQAILSALTPLHQQLDAVKGDTSQILALLQPKPPESWLAQQLRQWFAVVRYDIEQEVRHDDQALWWIINVPARRGFDRILVYGVVAGEARMSDLLALQQEVTARNLDEGWLVAARRIAPSVQEAVDNRRYFAYTFDDLLDQQADFSRYIRWLENEITSKQVDKYYVPLGCFANGHKEDRYDDLDRYVDQWLDDPSKEHLSVLGEFGTGKTWFTLHLAWRALQKYQAAQAQGTQRPRLPLVIPLRDYAKAVSVESLFSEFLFRQYEIGLTGYSVFEQLNRMGRFILIFDGFDEMASKIDRQKMINNFWELAKVVGPGSKVILTSRTEHFPHAQESRAVLGADLLPSTAPLLLEKPRFEVMELERFTKEQIKQVLTWRTTPEICDKIMAHEQLLDLAQRPVMITLILDALPEIEAGKPIDLARVYLYAVTHQLDKINTSGRSFTSTADKVYFMAELSWEMLTTNQLSINYRAIPDRIRRLFSDTVQEQKDLDHWDYDMRGQTMLIRNDEGDYKPAHKSLLEFFAAYKVAAEVGLLADDFVALVRPTDSTLPPQEDTWAAYFTRAAAKRPPLRRFSPSPTTVMADLCAHISNEEWREVFRFVTRLCYTPQTLFQAMQHTLTDMGARDEPLRQHLLWAETKAQATCAADQLAMRFGYFFLSHPYSVMSDLFTNNHTLQKGLLCVFFLAVARRGDNLVYRGQSLGRAINIARVLGFNRSDIKKLSALFGGEFALDLALMNSWLLAEIFAQVGEIEEYQWRDFWAGVLELYQDHPIQGHLQPLAVPAPAAPNDTWQTWADQLNQVMIQERQWLWFEGDAMLLDQYLKGNQTLVDCLEVAALTKAEKEAIRAGLFLPPRG